MVAELHPSPGSLDPDILGLDIIHTDDPQTLVTHEVAIVASAPLARLEGPSGLSRVTKDLQMANFHSSYRAITLAYVAGEAVRTEQVPVVVVAVVGGARRGQPVVGSVLVVDG